MLQTSHGLYKSEIPERVNKLAPFQSRRFGGELHEFPNARISSK